MSSYVASASAARGGGYPSSVVSVGETIDRSQVYNSSHPLYEEYTRRLSATLANIIARESEKQANAQQAVCTVSVSVDQKDELMREFPEFRVVWPQLRTPVHAMWSARRQLVNQYMTHHLGRYASSYAHYGGSALSYMTMGLRDVDLYTDVSSPIAVHDSFEDDVSCARLLAGAASAATAMGWVVSDDVRGAYVARDAYLKHSTGGRFGRSGEALIVDGGLYSMSPKQYMLAMIEHRASVGMFSLPYHSSMHLHSQGILPGVDVHYELTEHDVRFRYPQGVAGVTRYSAAVWQQWLVNTTRQVDELRDAAFQFELMGQRGCFMLIRVVRVSSVPSEEVAVVHSLQLEQNVGFTLVKTWRLKSLASNPASSSSWERVSVTVPTRVVEKTHDYVMALDAADFSRHAIRKRLAVVNDRVVVQGTSVDVHDALTSDQLDILEIALFTHCFVARYDSGKLAHSLRKAVDDVARFGAMGAVAKFGCIMTVCASLAYDWTIGAIDDRIRGAFDAARQWLGGIAASRIDEFVPVPEFVRYETLIRARGGSMMQAVKAVANALPSVGDLVPTMPGFSMASVFGAFTANESGEIPLIDLDDLVISRNGVDLFSDLVETVGEGPVSEAVDAMVSQVRTLNPMDREGGTKYALASNTHSIGVHAVDIPRVQYSFDPGYIATLDDFHDDVVPGMRHVDFKYDPSSISIDDQDRSLAADYLSMPLYQGEIAKPMLVYSSKLRAYNVTKRPMTRQETLSAMHARNLSAPVLALPQHQDELIDEIINDFLNIACVPEARQMLERFAVEKVSLEERALQDWGGKARPENVMKVFKYFVDNPLAWEELKLHKYDAMIKHDVKPPLSDKPLYARVEPQLIVHHITAVNAIFSSIFRVLVRRFLSLLKPNFMLNLLKDMPEVRDMMQAHHDWNATLQYLENDFSKYDKSQSQFVFALERKMFRLLGMNEHMLEHWALGHENCEINSVTTGISLHVRYQRKSGDATTAFGNGMLNLMSVVHAYKGTDVVWAVFMGDDSLVAARTVCSPELAVRALAEKFNLQAKFFVTPAPYFASNFVLVNKDERRIVCVPDPVKRVEKWSMAVTAIDPKWSERYRSAFDSCKVYMQKSNLVGLAAALYQRYGTTSQIDFEHVGDAIASAIRSEREFRAMWEDEAVKIDF